MVKITEIETRMKWKKNVESDEACLIFRFNDDPSVEKKLLPKYDDPATEEVFSSFFLLTFQSNRFSAGYFYDFLYSSNFLCRA